MTTTAATTSASSRTGPLIAFVIAAIIGLAADLVSKSVVFESLESPTNDAIDAPPLLVLIPDLLRFNTALNNGGIWSLGAEHGVNTNTALAIFSAVASVAIVAWAFFGIRRGQWVTAVVLGGILAGALGNLHDRLRFGGVRDFIQVHYQEIWYYPTFNVADSMLVCGAIFLVLTSIFFPPAAKPISAT